MVCLRERCRYHFCGYEEHELPPVGTPCIWEHVFAAKLREGFKERFPPDGLGRHLEDYEGHENEWIIAHLLMNRTSVRISRAMEEVMAETVTRPERGGAIDYRPYKHFSLVARYQTAAHRRLMAIYDLVPDLVAKRREDRIRTAMIANGYWRPYEDPEPPAIANAPRWIIELVDQ